MNDTEMTQRAAEMILQSLLTPVIYMAKINSNICFVCFLNGQTPYKQISDLEQRLTKMFGISTVILDIREFSKRERLAVIQSAELIYCEDDNTESILKIYILSDIHEADEAKKDLIDRLNNCNTIYIC